ncbi:hypothetical protein D8674_014749 [Pyrus ussuriensis x Pyrus communis]|uniref:GTD-binding domain-containing protein n=1 Tax=Pyrus ussuriensis x Pyrus communis TaxID=2448454 RepID=A0A5N5H0J3_9ROSA|nr:hypothetical protein D8674_014749 [Pyrus ussuriensis x Pyrus communis]
MAEGSVPCGMPETDITTLTEALRAQQQLLQKLYYDLDQEREASSTAADEALSMILRLQGEKSAMKMEASQYKRLAEEKICHSEEALAIFEDLIYQKEMEIASLEFQLQAYRHKLLSMGCSTELGAGENVYPENLLFQRNDFGSGEAGVNGMIRRINSRGDFGSGETGVSGAIRRINSLPPLELKELLKSTMERERDKERERDRDRPMIPKPEPATKKQEKKVDQEVNVQSIDVEKKSPNYAGGNMNTIWEQIKKLDARVKEISDCKDYGKSALWKGPPSRTCSLPPIPKISISPKNEPASEEIIASLQGREAIDSPSCYSSVHDVFEVPQSYEKHKAGEGEKKELNTLTVEVENRLGKPDLVIDEKSEAYVRDETDRVKKMLHIKKQENKIPKPRDGVSSVDSNLRERGVSGGVTESQQAKFQQLWRRIERLEGERNTIRQEISHAGEQELKLFREIHEHLNLIQSDMRSWKPKKPSPQDDEPLHNVMEAMLHFWL